MMHLSVVLLSVLIMTGNWLTGGSVPVHPNGSLDPLLSQPQDQKSVYAFFGTLTKYQVGIAYSGPKWTAEMDDVAKQNRAYISDLVNAKKLVGAGQVIDSKDLRWILFFQSDSLSEAQAILAAAPAVKAGRFTSEVRQTWGTKGVGSKMAEAGKAEAMISGPKATHFLAVFKKGSKWSPEENENTRKLIQNHITYVWKLYQDGALKLYGAFEGPGDIRSFAVLQAKSLDAAKKILKDDPALKANWVKLEYHTFEVSEGVLP